MDIQTLIRELMQEQSVTLEALGSRLGITRAGVCNALSVQRTIGTERAAGMLSALGYDLVAVPKGSRLPQGSKTVTVREADASL